MSLLAILRAVKHFVRRTLDQQYRLERPLVPDSFVPGHVCRAVETFYVHRDARGGGAEARERLVVTSEKCAESDLG